MKILNINKVYISSLMILSLPLKVFAEESASQVISSDPMSGSYLFQLVIGLLVVILCIVTLAWFAKRVNHLQASSGGILKILGGMSMGTREKVVLLQVGSEQLLIGVSPGRINTLHVLETPLDDTELSASTTGTNFSEKLSAMIGDTANISVKKNGPKQ